MAMTENEMAIRRLLNEPGFPSKRMTESQVSNEMLRDMEPDGQLDRARAEEMRRKLADQMFMDMRLRGASEFGGGRVANTGKPEDTSYAKADKAAALALSGQRANTQAEVDRRKRVPAAPDYTDERLREAQSIGFQADPNNRQAVVEEEADKIWLSGKMSGHPISYEDAIAVASDRAWRTLNSPVNTPGTMDFKPEHSSGVKDNGKLDYSFGKKVPPSQRGMVGPDPDHKVSTDGIYADPTYRSASRTRLENMHGPLSPKSSVPAGGETGPSPWEVLNAPGAQPVPPPTPTDITPVSDRDAITQAAMRAIAERTARRKSQK